jgi:hypothetical protein
VLVVLNQPSPCVAKVSWLWVLLLGSSKVTAIVLMQAQLVDVVWMVISGCCTVLS